MGICLGLQASVGICRDLPVFVGICRDLQGSVWLHTLRHSAIWLWGPASSPVLQPLAQGKILSRTGRTTIRSPSWSYPQDGRTAPLRTLVTGLSLDFYGCRAKTGLNRALVSLSRGHYIVLNLGNLTRGTIPSLRSRGSRCALFSWVTIVHIQFNN